MNRKHSEGYWISQLTDKQIEDIVQLTMSDHEKFSKMETPERYDTQIKVRYHYNRTNTYLHCRETKLTITDFSATGKNFAKTEFYKYMVETFGQEYAEELAEFLEEKIQNLNHDYSYVKGLVKFQKNLKTDLQNENTL